MKNTYKKANYPKPNSNNYSNSHFLQKCVQIRRGSLLILNGANFWVVLIPTLIAVSESA